MKKHISLLPAALALICMLTACGSDRQNHTQNDAHPDTPAADSGDRHPDTAIPNDDIVTPPDTTPGQSPAVTDDPSPGITDGVPVDEMLKNGRVHDRDGDLLDGENHVSDGATR